MLPLLLPARFDHSQDKGWALRAKCDSLKANQTKSSLEALKKEMEEFIASERATPAEIRTLAEEVQAITISLTPEQIQVPIPKCRPQEEQCWKSFVEFVGARAANPRAAGGPAEYPGHPGGDARRPRPRSLPQGPLNIPKLQFRACTKAPCCRSARTWPAWTPRRSSTRPRR